MTNPEALETVLEGIAEGPRTKLAARVLARCVRHMAPDGTVRLTRAELARSVNATEPAVSVVLASLRRSGALVCEHDRSRDVHMTIRVNSNLASGLPRDQREAAQAIDPPIRASSIPAAA